MSQQGMPPGWEAKWDPRLGRWYYINHSTRKTQWDDPRLTKPVVQTASPLDRNIDEIVKAYFPDLQDDQDTKNMVRGLFEADNNDKAMVINSLMEMGFKPGGRRVSEVESDNDDPLNARSIYQGRREQEQRQEEERIRREVQAELEIEKKKRQELERKRKEEERRKQERELRENKRRAEERRLKREREQKIEAKKRHDRQLEFAKRDQEENFKKLVSHDYVPQRKPKCTVTGIKYNSKLAKGPSGINNGPNEQLRHGPDQLLRCGRNSKLRSGPDKLLANGPDPSLRNY